MQKMASYVELVLSAFLLLVVVALSVRLIAQSVPQVWSQQIDVMYYLESAMTLAIGIEFVKMLCTHTSETIIEILLFAISRQMIVEHLSATETILGVGAIAGLFAVRKYLFCTIHEELKYYNLNFQKGFTLLTLGWSDGYSFIPTGFNLLSSASESNRYNEVSDSIDHRTNFQCRKHFWISCCYNQNRDFG